MHRLSIPGAACFQTGQGMPTWPNSDVSICQEVLNDCSSGWRSSAKEADANAVATAVSSRALAHPCQPVTYDISSFEHLARLCRHKRNQTDH